jgi:type 1 glutamine amidotransferase
MRMVLVVLAALSVWSASRLAAVHAEPRYAVLVFTKTAGYVHASIPAGVAAVKNLGQRSGFDVDATADAAAFRDDNLEKYAVVVFLSTTGDVLDDAQQAAFERYVRAGGGFVGIHSASDTEYEWPWYGRLVGAYFASHPKGTPTATVRIVDAKHPSTSGLPAEWERTDEWYDFKAHPEGVRVLAKLDESTYSGGKMGADHPVAWCHEMDGGRAFYTAMGHTEESYSDPRFLAHVLGGIEYAAARPQASR